MVLKNWFQLILFTYLICNSTNIEKLKNKKNIKYTKLQIYRYLSLLSW